MRFLAHLHAANEEAKEQRELRVRKGEVEGMLGFLEWFGASSHPFSLLPLTVTENISRSQQSMNSLEGGSRTVMTMMKMM